MASQPEGEEDHDYHLVVRDDKQPRIDNGDIDKGPEISGVPPGLNTVVDNAIELIRKVQSIEDDADLETIVEYIDIYLRRREPGNTVSVSEEFVADINEFYTQVWYHYNIVVASASASSDIFNILNQYCAKVKGIITGCLIATVQLKDDRQLGNLVFVLGHLASQLRKLIIGNRKMEISSGKSSEVPEKIRKILPHLLEAVTNRVRLEISMEKREMLNFLKGQTDEIRLTIMTRIHPLDPESFTKDCLEEFSEGFEGFEHTYREIQELFNLMSDEQKKLEGLSLTVKTSESKEGYEGEMGFGAEGKDSDYEAKPRKVYGGLLSPPPSSEKDETEPKVSKLLHGGIKNIQQNPG